MAKLKGGVRGKYYRQATAGTNLWLIEPELTNVFADTESSATRTRFRSKAQNARSKRNA